MSDPSPKLPNWLPFAKEQSRRRVEKPDDGVVDKTMGLGADIRRIRKNRMMTQAELGKRVGLFRTSIINMEKGQQSLSIVHLYDIAEALGCEVIIELRER